MGALCFQGRTSSCQSTPQSGRDLLGTGVMALGLSGGRRGGAGSGGGDGGGRGCRPTMKSVGVTMMAALVLAVAMINHLDMVGHQSSTPTQYEPANVLDSWMLKATPSGETKYSPTGVEKETQVPIQGSEGGRDPSESAVVEEKKRSIREGKKPAAIVGSDVDLDRVLAMTKDRIKREEEERVRRANEDEETRRRREEEEEEEEERRRREEEEAARRKREDEEAARKWMEEEAAREKREEEEKRRREEEERQKKEDEERRRKEEEEQRKRREAELVADSKRRAEENFKSQAGGVAMVPPVQMPSKVLERLPITGSPPLHRSREETKVERILFLMSTIDRGQRIGHWHGDKLQTILVILETVRTLCERGFDVTFWVVAAWKASEDHKTMQEALYCQRIQRPVHIKYWDHFPANISGDLSHKHRYAVKEAIDDYDFFISGEDDILITPQMFDAFLEASYRLAGAEDPNKYFPGFARKEHDKKRDGVWSLWETDADDYNALYIPGAGYFAGVSGNTHQAMWMGTREQLYHFDKRCDNGFFNIDPGPWVEFWSGALQLWDYCKGLRKVIPIDMFRDFTVWHMTDTKLYSRGKGVAPVEEIVKKLEGQKAEMEAKRLIGEAGGEGTAKQLQQ